MTLSDVEESIVQGTDVHMYVYDQTYPLNAYS